ncbi:hypothetical protein ACFL5S_00795 [Fibrobacterota bacterium]
MPKEISRSEIRNGKCTVNVNHYDKSGKCLSSTQYKGNVDNLTGKVTPIEKSGKSK